MDSFRYVGDTPTDLDGGRPIGPGEFTGPIDAELPRHQELIEEGKLIQVPDDHADKEQAVRDQEAQEAGGAVAEPQAEAADETQGKGKGGKK